MTCRRRRILTVSTPVIMALVLRLAGRPEENLTDREYSRLWLEAHARAEAWQRYLTREIVGGYSKPRLRIIYGTAQGDSPTRDRRNSAASVMTHASAT